MVDRSGRPIVSRIITYAPDSAGNLVIELVGDHVKSPYAATNSQGFFRIIASEDILNQYNTRKFRVAGLINGSFYIFDTAFTIDKGQKLIQIGDIVVK
ncbi:MAG: hypothetical protein IPJ37_16445 [Bacteroidales bacterium]|nr:hypothetical protein [Bacteroidales bacterium]